MMHPGYKGEDARRVWAAIYDHAVLKEAAAAVTAAGQHQVPQEQEVLYRLISGMHTAITTSIVQDFYNETTGGWTLPSFSVLKYWVWCLYGNGCPPPYLPVPVWVWRFL
jgi:hypothetical protein